MMISVEEARDKILSHISVLEAEEKPIMECLGQVLAEDIRSSIDIPPWDNSAMDGFAVTAESTRGAGPSSPRTLPVIGEVAAGAVFEGEVKPFNFIYSYHDNRASAIRQGPWKMHVRIGSQLKDNYGFEASRETPQLFQVEQDLGERIDRAGEYPELVSAMLSGLDELEMQIAEEGSFWDRN